MSWGNLLTEKVETSADGKTWTLTLKPDLKFSDGSPLTAEDVVFTYNKAAKSGGKIDMGNFTHASLKDNRTVEITLRSPQSTFVNVLGSLGIVPEKRYDEKTFAKNPIGAGPYRLVSFQPGQQLIVEANPGMPVRKMILVSWCLSSLMKITLMPQRAVVNWDSCVLRLRWRSPLNSRI